jgi:large subunit ribosomal protein L23
MKDAHDVIVRPYVTERSTAAVADGRYTFVVAPGSTKSEIRSAVEQLFGVKVLQVNTVNVSGKEKRQGVHVGNQPDWKKAIVTIDTDPKPSTYLAKGGKAAASAKKYKNSIEEFGYGQ